MKKLKWGILTCLTATSTVIPVLSTTACGKKTPEVNKIGAEYDKEYGVDQAVYAKLKNEFWNKREMQLRSDPEITTEDQIERERQDLNDTFKEYDNQLVSQQLSYTAATNAMIDYASQTYGIRLTIQTSKKTATWDDLTATFEGMVQSMNQYMIGSGIPEAQRDIVIRKAREDFVGNGQKLEDNPGLLPRIKAQYDDPLMGLIKAKAELLSCFSEMNYDIGLVASSDRLKNFMEDYEIIYDKRDDQSNKLDKLEKNAKDWFKVGADLSQNDHILNIYKITRKSDQKVLEHFEPDKVCPSYTVRPFLRRINKDARANTYTLDIDWTCVKTAYLQSNDAEKVEKTTAHFFKPNTSEIQQEAETDITSAYETLKKCSQESTLAYPITLTKEGEAKAIADTYFNKESEDGYIELGWDANPSGEKVNGFDALFAGMPIENRANGGNEYEYLVDSNSLAISGLTVSYNNATHPDRATAPVRLDDLIAVSGSKSKSSVEILEQQDQLVKDFINHCSSWSDTKTRETCTTNDGTYKATSSVYIDYNNTEYQAGEKTEGKYTSYCALKDETVENYKLSNSSYDYLIGEFNAQDDFVDDYKENDYKSEYKSAKNMSIVEGSFLTLTFLGVGLTVAKCAAPAFLAKLPVYIIIITIALLGAAGQIVMMSLNAALKAAPLGKFVKKLDKIKNSKEIEEFDNDLIQSANSNHLPRYNKQHVITKQAYDAGYTEYADKSDFFEDVLPTIEYYQNISETSSYQHCHDIIEENDVDPETYIETMETWDENGACTISYWTLFGATLLFDITVWILLKKNPELGDWTIMKQACVKARQSGEATESVVETYQKLDKMRKELAALRKSGQAANLTNDLKSVAAKETLAALEKAGMGTGTELQIPKITSEVTERALKSVDFLKNQPARMVGAGLGEMAEQGTFGLTRTLGKLTNFNLESMKALTNADRFVLKTCLDMMEQASEAVLAGEVLGEELATKMQGFMQFLDGLTASADRVVYSSILTAQRALRAGQPLEVFKCLGFMERVMYDTGNWTFKALMVGEQVLDAVAPCVRSLSQAVENAFTWLYQASNMCSIFTIL